MEKKFILFSEIIIIFYGNKINLLKLNIKYNKLIYNMYSNIYTIYYILLYVLILFYKILQ